MDLKLKDEVTKLLIANPGMSISDVAKKTRNYYSYTHKLISGMERQGLIRVERVIKSNKEVTKCFVSSDYKSEWVKSLRGIINYLMQDVEVKAVLAILYVFALVTVLSPKEEARLMVSIEQSPSVIDSSFYFDWGLVIIVLVPALIIFWFFRRKSFNK